MMNDTTEDLIREIAAKHGTAIGRDDPILILQTINHHLMQETQAAQEAMLERHKEELESIAFRWGNDAKEKAEKMLNASLAASKEAMAKTLQESAVTMAATLKKEVDAALTTSRDQLRASRALSFWNFAAAGLTFLAACIVLWTTF